MELGEVGCAGCSRREPAGDREKLLVSFCFACGAGMCVTGNWDGPGSRGFKCHVLLFVSCIALATMSSIVERQIRHAGSGDGAAVKGSSSTATTPSSSRSSTSAGGTSRPGSAGGSSELDKDASKTSSNGDSPPVTQDAAPGAKEENKNDKETQPKPAEVKNGGNEDKEKKKGAAGEDEGSTGKENDGDQHDREKENKDDGAAKDSTDGKAGGGGRSGKEDGENQSGNAKKQDSYAFLEVKNTRTGRSAGGAAKLLRTEKQPTKSQGFGTSSSIGALAARGGSRRTSAAEVISPATSTRTRRSTSSTTSRSTLPSVSASAVSLPDADGDANSFLHINEQQPVDVEHPKSVEVLVSLDEPPGEKKDITDDHPVISEEQQAEQGNTETADRGKNDKREKLKGGGRGNGASNKKEKKPPASANNNDDKKDEQKGDKKADNEKWREKDKLRAVLIALQILGGVLWLAALAQIWTWQPKCVKTDKKNAAVVGQTQIARAADGGKRKSKEVEDVKAKGARAGTGEVNTNGAEEGQDEDENAADSTSSASSDAEHADELDHADEGEREAE
eukprot:CAMPEP_0178999336 /NCGR_PEP_ID=MMETSP0795-20121207/9995_1 /TAXON_ID=88552 /ORGANISM="Amoebophrya sp., Strain Ameob2" /LENGTH=562 /DNA_ID=CAMNT_0020692081 /DNA_START=135 /DNA_END=1823 /DNA_ORIENTATION=+